MHYLHRPPNYITRTNLTITRQLQTAFPVERRVTKTVYAMFVNSVHLVASLRHGLGLESVEHSMRLSSRKGFYILRRFLICVVGARSTAWRSFSPVLLISSASSFAQRAESTLVYLG